MRRPFKILLATLVERGDELELQSDDPSVALAATLGCKLDRRDGDEERWSRLAGLAATKGAFRRRNSDRKSVV